MPFHHFFGINTVYEGNNRTYITFTSGKGKPLKLLAYAVV